jgi:hypothetical protein
MRKSMHAVGLQDRTSPQHLKNVAVLQACREAGVELPKALEDYFEVDGRDLKYVTPDDGVTVPLGPDIVTAYMDQTEDGLDVNLGKLPPGVKTIRFYNSY